jgi:hypothetical protein
MSDQYAISTLPAPSVGWICQIRAEPIHVLDGSYRSGLDDHPHQLLTPTPADALRQKGQVRRLLLAFPGQISQKKGRKN